MKAMRSLISLAIVALCFAWVMCSCSTTTVRVVTTDKAGTVTETTTTTKASDPAALALAGSLATAYAPRGMVVRQEKADHDMQRLLRGWRGPSAVAAAGPVTAEEIDRRWKPGVDTRAGK